MNILAIVWQPNEHWRALGATQQLAYLRSLDTPINSARAAGMVVLGWSEIDSRVPRSPTGSFVGVFGVRDAQQVLELEQAVAQTDWYQYFDSTNISARLQGINEGEPHRVYARLLDLQAD
ncbi:MAG: hypothetical protein KDI21_12630 [Halieaceae bacterium]|nr:hypothetical protein [Halieaceae bacterium]